VQPWSIGHHLDLDLLARTLEIIDDIHDVVERQIHLFRVVVVDVQRDLVDVIRLRGLRHGRQGQSYQSHQTKHCIAQLVHGFPVLSFRESRLVARQNGRSIITWS
jgi:hypothetical protein